MLEDYHALDSPEYCRRKKSDKIFRMGKVK